MSKRIVVAAALALALAAAGVATAAAVTHQSSASGAKGTVVLRQTTLGKVLATRSGKTLYLFMADRRRGKSACYGQCATYWPPLLVTRKPTAGAGLKARLLGTIKRKNGTRQITYAGHPLYRFGGDSSSGDVKGQGLGGVWHAMAPSGDPIM